MVKVAATTFTLLLSFSRAILIPSVFVRPYFWNAPPDFNAKPRATLHHHAWWRLNVIICIRRGHGVATEWWVH